MPGIMSNNDFRLSGNPLLAAPLMQIGDESLCRATDIEKIHRIRSNAGELRPLIPARLAAFCLRYDFSNGPPAQATRAKRKCLVKAIVQFAPLPGSDELSYRLLKKGRRLATEQR